MLCSVLLMCVCIAGASVEAWADVGAVSVAAGGLVARRESRVVMAKEVLRISLEKIVVDYDFRNDSDQDVTSEVAFPLPPYGSSMDFPDAGTASFSDFKLSIDGKPASFKTEVKAMFKGKDVTDILVKNKLDIARFGRFEGTGSHCRNFLSLPESEKKRLAGMGIIDEPDSINCQANWMVHLQYYWTQSFPAHSSTHIRHEYSPVSGQSLDNSIKALQNALTPTLARTNPKLWKASGAADISRYCLAPAQLRSLIQKIRGNKHPNTNYGDFEERWVDYILTTANTWRQPIEDFTLIVERPKPEEEANGEVLMGFCPPKNAKVEKLDADHTLVHLINFVPTAELHIAFFNILTMGDPDAE